MGEDSKNVYLLVLSIGERLKPFLKMMLQVVVKLKPLDRSDVYETKYISGLATLTNGDKKRLKAIHGKK